MCLMVNSGSSANFLALATLNALRPFKPGDEVITAACGFPTTVAPIIHFGAIPVFIDVDLGTYVPSVDAILNAVSKSTQCIMLAHTLGNPWPVKEISERLAGTEIVIIEDNCDSLGSLHSGQKTGWYGEFATQSFYPAHHITTGEGGALLMDKPRVAKVARSLRDWGRDCWCEPGDNDTCGKRFQWEFPGLPEGYDHKYIYSHLGYNLKATDLQASIGLGQLQMVEAFGRKRRANFRRLFDILCDGLSGDDYAVLPYATKDSDPSWFGFPITLGPAARLRKDVIADLQRAGIDTRMLFAGDMRLQPAMRGIAYSGQTKLPNTDRILSDTFWVGVWPGIPPDAIQYMGGQIIKAVRS
jgi:CDP-6-deoxy-D-xylo-4-hexulose-3-dehydrase